MAVGESSRRHPAWPPRHGQSTRAIEREVRKLVGGRRSMSMATKAASKGANPNRNFLRMSAKKKDARSRAAKDVHYSQSAAMSKVNCGRVQEEERPFPRKKLDL